MEKVHVNDLAVFKRDSGKSYRIRANTVFANHVHADEFRAIVVSLVECRAAKNRAFRVFETGQDGPLGKISSACPPAYGENLYSVATPVAQPANASIAAIANVVLMGSLPPGCSKVKQERRSMTSSSAPVASLVATGRSSARVRGSALR